MSLAAACVGAASKTFAVRARPAAAQTMRWRQVKVWPEQREVFPAPTAVRLLARVAAQFPVESVAQAAPLLQLREAPSTRQGRSA